MSDRPALPPLAARLLGDQLAAGVDLIDALESVERSVFLGRQLDRGPRPLEADDETPSERSFLRPWRELIAESARGESFVAALLERFDVRGIPERRLRQEEDRPGLGRLLRHAARVAQVDGGERSRFQLLEGADAPFVDEILAESLRDHTVQVDFARTATNLMATRHLTDASPISRLALVEGDRHMDHQWQLIIRRLQVLLRARTGSATERLPLEQRISLSNGPVRRISAATAPSFAAERVVLMLTECESDEEAEHLAIDWALYG